MKYRILFLFSLLAFIAIGNAQTDKDDKDPDDNDDEDVPIESDPSAAPVSTSSPTIFDAIDFNSTEPSESPNDMSVDNDEQTSSPTPSSDGDPSPSSPSNTPSSDGESPTTSSPIATDSGEGAPSAEPSPLPPIQVENCAGEPCDEEDSDACSCRSGLECRQRSIGNFICSQVSRTERTRLSTSENFGGAAGRDRGARTPA